MIIKMALASVIISKSLYLHRYIIYKLRSKLLKFSEFFSNRNLLLINNCILIYLNISIIFFSQIQQNNMMQPTQAYVLVNNSYQPINVTATNLMSCSTCGQKIPEKLFQSHLTSHLPYSPVQGTRRRDEDRPITLLSNLLQADERSDIDVATLYPDEIARKQTQRDKVNGISTMCSQFNDNEIENLDISEAEDQVIETTPFREEFSEFNEQWLAIEKGLRLQTKSQRGDPKKAIHLFENKGNQSELKVADISFSSRKKPERQSTQQGSEYDITTLVTDTPKKKGVQEYRFNYSKKKIGSKIKIDTKSGGRNTSQLHPMPYDLKPHQCPCCHGFYCSYCKSTIPPEYRPVNGQYDQNIADKIREHMCKPNRDHPVNPYCLTPHESSRSQKTD